VWKSRLSAFDPPPVVMDSEQESLRKLPRWMPTQMRVCIQLKICRMNSFSSADKS
jgi:hypothetical protein